MSKHDRVRPATLASALLVATAIAGPALAQSTGSTNKLDEIVVTAQRREENLNDVPIAVQAFTQEALTNTGVQSLEDLGTITSSLNITNQLAAVTPYIRGVGTPEGSVGAEQSVALYVDGVYMANASLNVMEFNNIERIEVAKGPQGTLFGRNSTGGLVQIITKDPEQEPGVISSVSYDNYETIGTKLYATSGIAETLAADVAVTYKDQGKGWGDNVFLDTDINKRKEFAVRTKWLFTPGDATSIRFIADYGDARTSIGNYNALVPGSLGVDGQLIFAGCVQQLGGNPTQPTAPQFATCQPAAAAGATGAPDDFQDSFSALPGVTTTKTAGASIKLDHDFGSLSLVSLSSYRKSEATQDFDQTSAISPLPQVPLLVHLDIDEQSYKTFAQELQLLSQGERFKWIVGAYYYKDESGFDDPHALGISGLLVRDPATGSLISQNVFSMIDTESFSIFGEATYSLTPSTRLTAGVRGTRDEREIDQQVFVNGVQAVASKRDDSWEEPTWRLILDHDILDATMLYASYSRGFKSGNFNISAVGADSYDPEFLDAYEIGVKSTLADGSVQLNAAVYHYKYDDLQVNRAEAGSLVTVNAASAEMNGVEVDLLANVTEHLQVRAGLSWIDAEYEKFSDAPAYLPTGIGGNALTSIDAAGNKLVRVPKYTFNVGGTYTLPVTIAGGKLLLGGNFYYNDGFYWEAANRTRQDSYELLSLNLGWRNADDTWGVRVYGTNLTDEEHALFSIEQAVGDLYEPAEPAVYGIEASVNF